MAYGIKCTSALGCGTFYKWECSGSVVECLSGDHGVVGSSLTGVTTLCP